MVVMLILFDFRDVFRNYYLNYVKELFEYFVKKVF